MINNKLYLFHSPARFKSYIFVIQQKWQLEMVSLVCIVLKIPFCYSTSVEVYALFVFLKHCWFRIFQRGLVFFERKKMAVRNGPNAKEVFQDGGEENVNPQGKGFP